MPLKQYRKLSFFPYSYKVTSIILSAVPGKVHIFSLLNPAVLMSSSHIVSVRSKELKDTIMIMSWEVS